MHLQLQNKLKLTNKIINTQQNKYIWQMWPKALKLVAKTYQTSNK
jgi:hypothetical protein